jgi:hypothetical protein
VKVIAITPDRKTDCICSMIIDGFNDLGYNVIASDPGNNVVSVYTDDEIIEHSKDAEFIFVFWGKVRGNRLPKYYLLDKINRPEVTVYIDGSEWTATGYPDGDRVISAPWGNVNSQVYEAKFNSQRCKGTPWINKKMLEYCNFYFKRECYPADLEYGIFPLNVGCQNKNFGNIDNSKDIDVFCSFGQLGNGYRYEINNFCQQLKTEGYKIEIKAGLDYNSYLDHISRSYISVSSWGAGNSCQRQWENMANKSCCFVQDPEIEVIFKPQDNIHCIYYKNMVEFESKIRKMLNNKQKCIEIGNSGFEFVKKHHTGVARVNYILDKIGYRK